MNLLIPLRSVAPPTTTNKPANNRSDLGSGVAVGVGPRSVHNSINITIIIIAKPVDHFRLFSFIFSLHVISWTLPTTHPPSPTAEPGISSRLDVIIC